MNKRLLKRELHYYKRVLAVQELYMEKRANHVNNEKIYENWIFPVYFIARSTFYDYLTVNAKAKIKEIENVLQNKSN